MTWQSQGPAQGQDPRGGGQPGPWQAPPGYTTQPGGPGYPPPGAPPGYPPPGAPPGYPPQGYPPQGYPPPPGGPYPPAPTDYPPSGPMWQPPPAYPLAPDAYPVNVSYDRAARIDRLWGIPIIGWAVRGILLIPHFIILWLLSIWAAVLTLITWIPVLLLGRFPGWGYRWIGGLMGWSIRVQAYLGLLTPTYPPFSLSGEGHPVSVRYDEGVRINRLWGIPILGLAVRALILIPHYIVLWVLAIVVWVLWWFTWIPVLVLGRQADLIYTLIGGWTRWWLRVAAYQMLMVDRYPPFSLGEDDPRL